MKVLLSILLLYCLTACHGQDNKGSKQTVQEDHNEKTIKTDAEWRELLSPAQYEILRNKGTEHAFTGEYWNHFEEGVYVCAACKIPLFTSDAKFDSDCGWPSFDQAIKGSVTYKQDNSHGMKRTEVLCAGCGGHLGHVFDDGPRETTGNRFCTNSISINFVPVKK